MLKSTPPSAPTPSSSRPGSFEQEINGNQWPKFAATCKGCPAFLLPSVQPLGENKARAQRPQRPPAALRHAVSLGLSLIPGSWPQMTENWH